MSVSARLFLERYGLKPTFVNPSPQVAPQNSPIHTTPTLPATDVAVDSVFREPPLADRTLTNEPWPTGDTSGGS